MDINKILFIIASLYIAICIGAFIRCKSYGIANNIAVCFLIIVPPLLICFIFFFPLALLKKRPFENYWQYMKRYLKAVSIMLRLAPFIVLGLGMGVENIAEKLTGKTNSSTKYVYFKNIYSELKTVFQY